MSGSFSYLHAKECRSTQERIVNLSGGDWVVYWSDVQRAGYGRKGDSWSSEQGGLYYSIRYPLNALDLPQPLHLLTAINLWYEILQSQLPNQNLSIKWPNDLLLNGKKIAGILGDKKGGSVTLGVGLNVNNTFTDTDRYEREPVSLLEATGEKFSRKELLFTWIRELKEVVERDESHPINKNTIEQRMETVGELIRNGSDEGRAIALDDQGGLVVQFEDQTRTLYASDDFEVLTDEIRR